MVTKMLQLEQIFKKYEVSKFMEVFRAFPFLCRHYALIYSKTNENYYFPINQVEEDECRAYIACEAANVERLAENGPIVQQAHELFSSIT